VTPQSAFRIPHLVDSHCHLDFPQFDADRMAVIQRAAEAGVGTLLSLGVGSGPPALDAGLKIAELAPPRPDAPWPVIYTSVGVHPHEAKQAGEADFAELERLGAHPKVLAVGEIGLDFHYDHSPRETQRVVFIRQMEIAARLGKPIIIHCREAWPECLDLLRSHWRCSGLGGVLHCFSGDAEIARQGLDLGFLISFAGNVTFPKAEDLRQAARNVPPDRLLIETDSPYLAPVPHRGRRNEPAFVAAVAQRLAEARGVAAEDLARQTSDNFRRFFRPENL
jgi:TatD DNase family protein